MLKAKSTPYMPTYYHQRTHHKQRKPHAISGGGGPDLSASGRPFFFSSPRLHFFPFSIGGTKARAITSQHGKQKNTHKFTGNSLYRGKVNFCGGGRTLTHQETPPPPPGPNSGPNWERKKAAAEARSELCGASGVWGGGRGGRIGGFLERRGEGERIPRDSLLSSPLLVSSSLPRVGVGGGRRCVWPSAAGCPCQPFYLGLLRYRMTCP